MLGVLVALGLGVYAWLLRPTPERAFAVCLDAYAERAALRIRPVFNRRDVVVINNARLRIVPVLDERTMLRCEVALENGQWRILDLGTWPRK